jgi:hypothetical protein
MAYSNYTTYVAGTTGEQPSINVDPSINPFSVTVAVAVLAGTTASFGLEWSFDDFSSVSDANATWFTDKLIPTGTTTSTYENYNTPATRVRLNIATNTAGAGIAIKVLQGFTIN